MAHVIRYHEVQDDVDPAASSSKANVRIPASSSCKTDELPPYSAAARAAVLPAPGGATCSVSLTPSRGR